MSHTAPIKKRHEPLPARKPRHDKYLVSTPTAQAPSPNASAAPVNRATPSASNGPSTGPTGGAAPRRGDWRTEGGPQAREWVRRQGPLAWPVPRVGGQHQVQATVGEPRGVLDMNGLAGRDAVAALERRNPLERAQRGVHDGIDIYAPPRDANGALRRRPVTANINGVVAGIRRSNEATTVDVHPVDQHGKPIPSITYRFAHLDPSKPLPRVGERVRQGQTVIGQVHPNEEHVHFSIYVNEHGRRVPLNPLDRAQSGGMQGYRDRARPVLGETLRAYSADGTQSLDPMQLRGRVTFAVGAYDVQSQGGKRTGLQRLDWRVVDNRGQVVLASQRAFDARAFHGTSASDTGFTLQSTRHALDPAFTYHTGRGDQVQLDTSRLPAGSYRVVFTASDLTGNRAIRSYPIGVAGDGDAFVGSPANAY